MEEWEASVEVRAGVTSVVPEAFGEESAVALPPSDCSLGIWTCRRGLLGFICRLLVLDGGAMGGTDGVDWVR